MQIMAAYMLHTLFHAPSFLPSFLPQRSVLRLYLEACMEQSTDDQEGRACAFITVFRMHALLVLSGSLSMTIRLLGVAVRSWIQNNASRLCVTTNRV